jgi:hypothetical protein
MSAIPGRSLNGWPLLSGAEHGELPKLRRWLVPTPGAPGERHLYLRDGSAGFLLIHLALWFHEEVERLDLGVWDEWGYAPRPIRGGSAPSNHGSGTAADLNATRHPFRVPTLRTFTPAQVRAIRHRLKLYRGLIDWGGAWRPENQDAMHFELAPGSTLARVEHRARQLIDSPRGKRVLAANPGALAIIKK